MLCSERIEKDQQAICVEACPMYAIDIGPIEELQKKYGDGKQAVGFKYSDKLKPSVVHKSR